MYQLAPQVFVCTTGRNCMFLDLRQDSYVSVPRTLMDSLAPHIHGWQLPVDTHQRDVPSGSDTVHLAGDLLEAGILCPYREGAAAPPPPPAPAPATRDFTSLEVPDMSADAHGLWAETLATLACADSALRLVPLWRIVNRISAYSRHGAADLRPEPLDTAGTLVRRFRAIRPWYPRDYLCLFDSLGLTLLLLRRGIRARWIFGVREDPFAAHCWVQFGGIVLNEFLDRAHLYTPIMAV